MKHLPSPRCASGTASRCRPLLHPSPGRGPGLTESESALRTSITTSLLSHISTASAPIIDSSASLLSHITSPRHPRPSSTAPHHKSHTPAAPHQAERMTAEAVTYSVNPRQRRGLLASALCVAESIAAEAPAITDIISSRRETRAATRFEDALLPQGSTQ
jgi:hypothetical protein